MDQRDGGPFTIAGLGDWLRAVTSRGGVLQPVRANATLELNPIDMRRVSNSR